MKLCPRCGSDLVGMQGVRLVCYDCCLVWTLRPARDENCCKFLTPRRKKFPKQILMCEEVRRMIDMCDNQQDRTLVSVPDLKLWLNMHLGNGCVQEISTKTSHTFSGVKRHEGGEKA